jgi:hypothetical protein
MVRNECCDSLQRTRFPLHNVRRHTYTRGHDHPPAIGPPMSLIGRVRSFRHGRERCFGKLDGGPRSLVGGIARRPRCSLRFERRFDRGKASGLLPDRSKTLRPRRQTRSSLESQRDCVSLIDPLVRASAIGRQLRWGGSMAHRPSISAMMTQRRTASARRSLA